MIKKELRYQFYYSALLVICFLVFSCKKNEVYLYDKTGFDPGYNSYSQPAYYPPKYVPYYQPRSRAYRNPYKSAPYNYYPYYDTDHYYVPPTEFKTIERDEGFYPKY